MNKNLVLFFTSLTISSFCVASHPEPASPATNPGLSLNAQDVPLFYEGNPLEGLNAFAVLPPYSIVSQKVNKRIERIIQKELSALGKVVKSKSEDVTGFGSGNLLNIQIGRVSKWDGGELPISRVTLSIETPVMVRQTNVKSLPRVWSINDFVDSPLDAKSEDKAVGAIEKLLKEFAQNYQFANRNQTQKPIFYIYD